MIPYVSTLFVGFGLYYLSQRFSGNLSDLLLNISAAFFTIPAVLLFYELFKELTNKKLNKEIFDYAKIQIDTEMLSLINQLMKMVYPLEKKDFSEKGVNQFLSMKKDILKKTIVDNKYLGFQVYKKWEVSLTNLNEILKNPFILQRLNNEQIISIICIIKDILYLEQIFKIPDLYVETKKKVKGFKIAKGTEFNKENIKYPDRYILLKDLKEDKFVVFDFGDFDKYNIPRLNNEYVINPNRSSVISETISGVMQNFNNWLKLTDYEFIIDTQMFKMTRISRR